LPNTLCANDDGHLHRIQAKQQHVELQEELVDHIQDSDMALLNQSLLGVAQYMCHRYVLLCSHRSKQY
jgi:hypothetical protein